MGGVAGPELVAAVSEAGGLGILAALRLRPDEVRAGIGAIRQLTDRPFGVNIWLHDDVRVSPDPQRLPADEVRRAQSVLNRFRARYDLPATLEPPRAQADLVDAAIEIMIDERIPVFSSGLGIPEPELVERFHQVGTRVMVMVASADDAAAAAASGADVIVAQGTEAGGHRSHGSKLHLSEAAGTGTFSLVPQVVDRLAGRAPVVAAGGVADGRGLAAALVLGAEGVLLGTRFVATAESLASPLWKQRLVGSSNQTTLTDGFTGQWARTLRSEFTDRWAEAGAAPLPGLLQAAAAADIYQRAQREGDDQMQPLYAGDSAPLIDDLPGAGEVVRRMVAEAEAALGRPL
jgi:nitronate monooxygenase